MISLSWDLIPTPPFSDVTYVGTAIVSIPISWGGNLVSVTKGGKVWLIDKTSTGGGWYIDIPGQTPHRQIAKRFGFDPLEAKGWILPNEAIESIHLFKKT